MNIFLKLALLLFIIPSIAHAENAGKNPVFGSKEKLSFSLQGNIYYLRSNTYRLPDFSKLKPVGTIFTKELNIPEQDFDKGFPGVTDRFEWFAIDYTGQFIVKKKEKFRFRLNSDDGSKLFIDGRLVINNDGGHPPRAIEGEILLKSGMHKIEVQYFQGPKMGIALVLEIAREGKDFAILNMDSLAPAKIIESKKDITIILGGGLLFDSSRSTLKPEAISVLTELKNTLLKQYTGRKLFIDGYTDNIGSKPGNIKLSNRRAGAVANWLISNGISKKLLSLRGYGEAKPRVPNSNADNRAQNRRVEIRIIKTESKKYSSNH